MNEKLQELSLKFSELELDYDYSSINVDELTYTSLGGFDFELDGYPSINHINGAHPDDYVVFYKDDLENLTLDDGCRSKEEFYKAMEKALTYGLHDAVALRVNSNTELESIHGSELIMDIISCVKNELGDSDD